MPKQIENLSLLQLCFVFPDYLYVGVFIMGLGYVSGELLEIK